MNKRVVHKIRPGVWYSKRPQRFLPFASLEDFVAAVEETVYQNVDTHDHAADWRNRFLDGYRALLAGKASLTETGFVVRRGLGVAAHGGGSAHVRADALARRKAARHARARLARPRAGVPS